MIMRNTRPPGTGRFLSALALIGCLATTAAAQGLRNVRITALSVRDMTGKGHNLDSPTLQGKTILWYFWSHDNRPSVRELQHLVQIHGALKEKSFTIVTVCLGDNQSKARRILKQVALPVVHVVSGKGDEDPTGTFLRVQGKHVPFISLMNVNRVIYWSGPSKEVDSQLAQKLGVKIPTVLLPAETDEEAVVLLSQAVLSIDKDPSCQSALKRLALVPDVLLERPRVLPHAVALAVRLRVDKRNAKEIASALKGNRAAARKLRRVTEAASRLLKASLLGGGTTTTRRKRSSREELAVAKLAKADRLRNASDHAKAYRAYKEVAAKYPGTDPGQVARSIIEEYEQDDTFMAAEQDRQALALLRIAQSYVKAGLEAKAIVLWQNIIDRYPKSVHGETARKAIADHKK